MKWLKGDLIALAKSGSFDVIVHGCNAFCNFGAGIALQIKNELPQAFEEDKKTTKGDKNKIGTYTQVKIQSSTNPKHEFIVINAYTQFSFGGKKDHFEYGAFQKILDALKLEFPEKKIGFPLIGCGHAGGNKNLIISMIEKTLPNANIVEFVL